MKTAIGLVLAAGAALAQDPGRAETVRKLESMKVTVDFQEATLADAVAYLRDVTGLNFVLHPRALEAAGDAPVRLKVRDLSVRSVLRLMLRGRDLAAGYRDGAIVILPRAELEDQVTLRMYDVRALLVRVPDFAGPTVELTSPQTTGPLLQGIQVTFDPPEPSVPPELLVELVRACTGGASWQDNPNAAAELKNGMLVVSQAPAVHREVAAFLRRLEQYR